MRVGGQRCRCDHEAGVSADSFLSKSSQNQTTYVEQTRKVRLIAEHRTLKRYPLQECDDIWPLSI